MRSAGYRNFVDKLADSLEADGVDIHLNAEVTDIRWRFGQQAIYVKSGRGGEFSGHARPLVVVSSICSALAAPMHFNYWYSQKW